MATFDGWDSHLYGYSLPNGQDTLAHFRTKGSKNGVRRFQNEDGTWTPLGLRERKEREGWGDGDRKARKAERKIAKAERRQARNQRIEDFKEKRRKNSLKDLTDEEIQKKISRLKLEQEYKELSKSPVLKAGENAIKYILNYKAEKEQREIERNKQIIEKSRIDTQKTQAIEATKKAKYDAKAASAEKAKMKYDVKGGLKTKRKADLTNAKTALKGTTIWGAIGKAANNRAKYKQENRMNAIEAKKAARTRALQLLQNERNAQTTEQERWKSEQEKWKYGQAKYASSAGSEDKKKKK